MAGSTIYLYPEDNMIKRFFILPVLLLALSMLLIACGEGEDDEEMHVDADGFILMVDEEEVYRQFQGTETGGISLKVGDELDVHVVFINHDSEEYPLRRMTTPRRKMMAMMRTRHSAWRYPSTIRRLLKFTFPKVTNTKTRMSITMKNSPLR